MNEDRKAIDFFRPTRSTDPLVGRPKKTEPEKKIIRREKVSSRPPELKKSPNDEKEKDLTITAKKPVYSSTIVFEESRIVKKSIPKQNSSEQKPTTKEDENVEEDWFDSLKNEGMFGREDESYSDNIFDSEKQEKKKSPYSFVSDSPFLKSVKVEKRPLSNSVPKKETDDLEKFMDDFTSEEEPKFIEEKKKGIPFPVVVALTIILGVLFGIAVFALIS